MDENIPIEIIVKHDVRTFAIPAVAGIIFAGAWYCHVRYVANSIAYNANVVIDTYWPGEPK